MINLLRRREFAHHLIEIGLSGFIANPLEDCLCPVCWAREYRSSTIKTLQRDAELARERSLFFYRTKVDWPRKTRVIVGLTSVPEVDFINFVPRVRQPVLMLNGRYDNYFPVESAQEPFFRCWAREVSRREANQVTGLSYGNGVTVAYGYSNDRLQMTSRSPTPTAERLCLL
jgi:hypothetical protein